MGETGIGKTALVKCLSSIMTIKFDTLNINASINSNDIKEFVQKYNNSGEKVLLFFDEINTNENIGGILKEIIIDRKLDGFPLKDTIITIAACNPYKLNKDN